ncbi:MAG: branched-chain amino acid ABC transporter permease [Chloroflexi bacterium]|nr:branched-chain amino acid ABC transporter permease [Chloroflexota bacterium]
MQPCGVFNTSYRQDMAIVRTRLQWGMLIGFFVFLVLLPLITPIKLGKLQFGLFFFIFTGTNIITLHGLNIVMGFAGQLSLGQSAFMAVGAFAVSNLVVKLDIPFIVALPLGGLIAAFVGMIFGTPCLRIKGLYLLMATVAAHFIIAFTIIRLPAIGGTLGLMVPPPSIFGFELNTDVRYYYMVMMVTIIMTILAINLARGSVGRAFMAIRDDEVAARVMGINTFVYKALAFGISAFFAGIAGALVAFYLGMATVDHFTLVHAIWLMGMLAVGGMASTMGVIFGAIFFNIIDTVTTVVGPMIQSALPFLGHEHVAGIAMALWALVIIIFLIFEPRGINHRWEILRASYRLHPFSYTRE